MDQKPIADAADSKERAELLENSGMGAPPEDPAEEAAEPQEDKPEVDPKKPAPKEDDEAEDESEEEEDEAEESEDEDEADEDDEEGEEDEEPETPKNPARTVPYSLLKAKNAKIKQLEAALADKSGKADESGDEDDAAEVETAAEALAKELGADDVDKTRLTKILKAAAKLAARKGGPVVLPKEVTDRLKLLDKYEADNKEKTETAHFQKEWNGLLPAITKQYPGATQAILAEAMKLMDDLSHSKKFHDKDLDYVLFKNRDKFDTVLKVSPKNKGGEAGKTMAEQDIEEGDEEQLTDIENLTPDIMKQREGRSTDSKIKHKDYKVQHPIR